MPVRLLIIGLDGADGQTLDRASRDGTLPSLAALRERGRAWALSSEQRATDDALWASFQYGVGIGEHGRYAYQVIGHPRPSFIEEADRETFWDRLSDFGLRVAIFDVPKCRRPRPLNGIHLADWLVHGRYFATPLSYPSDLADDVLARFGAPPPSLCQYNPPLLDDDGVRTVRDNLLLAVAQKRAAGLHYLAAEPWDLFMIGFKETHCSCHMFWDLVDPAHRGYDPARVERLGNPVLDTLRAQDAAIGDLIAAAGPEAEVVVFSTTDYAPNGSLGPLVPEIVASLNDHIARHDRPGIRATVGRMLGFHTPLAACELASYSDNGMGLRVARHGEESAERHARRVDWIEALVRELVDADDGQPVISAVTRPVQEWGPGRRSLSFPHLLLHFRSNCWPRAVTSPRLGRLEMPRRGHLRAGNHEPGGFAFAAGPAVTLAAKDVKSMEDFASLITNVLLADGKPAAGKTA